MRKLSVSLVLLLVGVAATCAAVAPQDEPGDDELFQWAVAFVQRSLVIDGHCDTVMGALRGRDLSVRSERGHIDIPRMIEGGLDAQFFACWVPPGLQGADATKAVLDMLDVLYQTAAKDERFVIVDSADDILRAKKEWQVACIPAIEGGHAIAGDIRVLRDFRRLGVRYMTLTWNNSNEIADSSEEDQSRYGNLPHRGGLTEFGQEVVREMNRIGMIVDLSHVHDDTFWDVIEISTKPVIVSHSCCWAINPHQRNVKDDMLQALARNGGVIGINYLPSFLDKEYNDKSEVVFGEMRKRGEELREKYKDDQAALEREWAKLRQEFNDRLPPVPISVLVDHIDHVVKVAGIDHVGLGSDFDGISSSPEKLDDVTDIAWILVELRKRGYSEQEMRKILGENFLRVIRANDVDRFSF